VAGAGSFPPMSKAPWTVRGVVRTALFSLALLFLIGFVVATARLFLWPPTNQPVKADAVIALGGDSGQLREKLALHLAKSGYAPVAVVSLGGKKAVPCPHPVTGIKIICFRADPLNTRGEAEYVARLTAERHWHRIIVVSERSQATRARMLFKRCTRTQLIMVPVADPRSHLAYDVAYEWGALAKALVLERSC
jgi:uncharacterized SAM-binding protein YcdF (DUF218 family)